MGALVADQLKARLRVSTGFAKPEIDEFRAVGCKDDVSGFRVMHAGSMGLVQGIDQLHADLDRFGKRQRTFLQTRRECGTLDIPSRGSHHPAHRHRELADVRVVQTGYSLRFALKSLLCLGVS